MVDDRSYPTDIHVYNYEEQSIADHGFDDVYCVYHHLLYVCVNMYKIYLHKTVYQLRKSQQYLGPLLSERDFRWVTFPWIRKCPELVSTASPSHIDLKWAVMNYWLVVSTLPI